MFNNDLIIREDYLKNIRPFIDIKMVKILAGVRRSGKSYILDMLCDELINRNVKKDHIIYKIFTDVQLSEGYNNKDLYLELKEKIKDNDRYYFLLDEIQEVEEWERAINTLFESENVDIYVTGSNSKLVNENISSYLSGRYILVPIFTLSFKEYLYFKNIKDGDLDELFREYLRFGGFPLIASNNFSQDIAYQIVEDIYRSIITKDIISNHPIKDVEKFNRVLKFIMDNMGKTFSANSIASYFKSQKREISYESIYNYISWLKDSFIIYECNRYDLQGKAILKTQEKYYLSDISLKYALFGYNRKMESSVLENIIYLELKRRGYNVYIGKYDDKEIDFIATKRDEEIHIQVTVRLPDSSLREIENLRLIDDYHHKYVVTTSRNDVQIIDGIKVIHIVDFLLMENY